MRLRVATYNIHRCVGGDGQSSSGRIAAVLKEINPDVVALQEVASTPRGGPRDVLSRLAAAIEARPISGPTLLEPGGQYGNAVLTRKPTAAVERLDISVPGREPRGAMAAVLEIRGRPVRLVAAHLGLRPSERRYQVRQLLTLLDGRKTSLTIVLGDFNEWFNPARPLRWLNRRLGKLPAPATFPSRRPIWALDRIWVHPPDRLGVVRVHRSDTALIASDHLPLVAEVRV